MVSGLLRMLKLIGPVWINCGSDCKPCVSFRYFKYYVLLRLIILLVIFGLLNELFDQIKFSLTLDLYELFAWLLINEE